MQRKYIFVTGGVVSSLGKGVAAASIGALLKSRGFSVHMRKFDPYLNIDPGAMSPLQHGEVYVTNDGYETDLDLGYYERFLEIQLSRNDSVSAGKVFWEVLNKERRGDYHGATIQLIPHITNQIKEYIGTETNTDFVICELGGTIGDIEQLVFIEALRQFSNDIGRENAMFVHLSYVPYIAAANEIKTKPTQASVRLLLEKGIQADMILCRTAREMGDDDKRKLAMFCNLKPASIIEAPDLDNIYKVPLAYEKQNIVEQILLHFGMDASRNGNLAPLQRISDYLAADVPSVNIGVVGKYFSVPDSYKSLFESLFHAGIANNIKVKIHKINAEDLEKMDEDALADALGTMDGILVPGGFGERGIPGKMLAAGYARKNKIPYFGICLGMQLAVIEFMRNVCGIKDANSTEFTKNCTPIISLMSEWEKDGKKEIRTENSDIGGTLRLGAYPCVIAPDTLAAEVYGLIEISERHRHRYEMDLSFEEILNKNGMIVSGKSPDGKLPEIIELAGHPFFIAGQFHPEFQSSPFNAHPLFKAFVRAAAKTSNLPL
ncbi:MAG: CTP synthase [Rickettsiales bacterium]|jgi:CTP synthase|nr:CTP synthase [Rickettsiales bacterium]